MLQVYNETTHFYSCKSNFCTVQTQHLKEINIYFSLRKYTILFTYFHMLYLGKLHISHVRQSQFCKTNEKKSINDST
jgi:hypothetical protein